MTKTQLKDALKNIGANKVSFISIIVIAMLAAVTYLAITFSAEALSRKASNYYAEQEMWDLQVSSTLLMDGVDLDAIRALPGVEKVEGIYQMPAVLRFGKKRVSVSLTALTESITRPEIREGRLPEKMGECMVEQNLAEQLSLQTGDRFTVTNLTVAEIDPVKQKDYVITGIFRHPDHISYRISVTPYVLVTKDCFDLETLDGTVMSALIRVADAPWDRYGDEYLDKVNAVRDELNQIAGERAHLRTERMKAQLQEMIDEGQKKLDEGQDQLDEARAQVAAAQDQLAEGRAKADAGQRELEDALEQLGVGKDKLDNGELELKDAAVQLKDAAQTLKEAREQLRIVDYYVAKGRGWILEHVPEDKWPPDIGISYEEFVAMLNQDAEKVLAWAYAKTGYTAGLEKFKHAQAEFEANRLKWYDSGETYLDGLTSYERGKKQLEEGLKQLEEGEKKLRDSERQIAERQAEWDEGHDKLVNAMESLEQMGDCRWIVLTDEGNGGYLFARANAENFDSLSMTFSLLFVIVAALVIYATVARIVEEQSKLVGATKAMGLYNREILMKYLIFGVTSTLLGLLLGIVLARCLLEPLLLKVYGGYFAYGMPEPVFLLLPSVVVTLCGVLLSGLSVWLACSKLLSSPAISLMQGTTLTNKLTSAKRSSKGSLYTRMILLNMRTDLKRVLVTTVSIAGSCSLLMIGFTLKYAIDRVSDRQFEGIITHDLRLSYETVKRERNVAALEKVLEERGLEYVRVYYGQRSFIAADQLSSGTLIVVPGDRMEKYYTLRDAFTKEPLEPSDSGIVIPLRMHEYYELDPGDSFQLNDEEMAPHKSTVAAVAENYYPINLWCTPEAYEANTGAAVSENCFLIRLNGADASGLEDELDDIPGFISLDDARGDREHFVDLTTMMNLLVVVMILLAGMLAFFILLNLSNTFIQQKNRELTIMRINGFTTAECIRYVATDMTITTLLGTAVGLVVGYFLGDLIAKLMEQPNIMYVHEPDLRAFLFSALLSIALAAVINSFALRKIKNLRLHDLA